MFDLAKNSQSGKQDVQFEKKCPRSDVRFEEKCPI